MNDRPAITQTIIQNLLATGGSTEELIEAAYDLGVSHGMVHKTQRAKRNATRIEARAAQESATAAIVNFISCRTELEKQWYSQLTQHHYLVEYEPKKFHVMVNGLITHYTPDFRITHKDGWDPWYLEVKPEGWPHDLPKHYIGKKTCMKQLRAMQATVKEHRIKLLVASGRVHSDYQLYQALGLDIHAPTGQKTLPKLHRSVALSGL